MAKRFKSKKKRSKIFKVKYLIYPCLLFLIYQLITGTVIKMRLTNNNSDFLLAMMKDSNHYILYEQNENHFITKATRFLTGINMNKPVDTLKTAFHYDDKEATPVVKEVKEEPKVETGYIKSPVKEVTNDPRVYIYNTHQQEGYSMQNLEPYNITPNVMMASYLLKEKLDKGGVKTIVEETDINDFMNINNWTHKDSYKASRQFMTQAIEKYKNLDLLIDLHRDVIKKNASTITINGKNYAKVLFVIGLNNNNYAKNQEVATKISELLNQFYPGISRGLLPKKGSGVNGVYNQDMHPKSILIECGGYENTIDEVSNTVEALSEILLKYLGDENEA